MTFLEVLLFAGWLLPVLFIGASAIFVSTIAGPKEAAMNAHAGVREKRTRRMERDHADVRSAGSQNRVRRIAQDSAVFAN